LSMPGFDVGMQLGKVCWMDREGKVCWMDREAVRS
jgi:hypothetical protein